MCYVESGPWERFNVLLTSISVCPSSWHFPHLITRVFQFVTGIWCYNIFSVRSRSAVFRWKLMHSLAIVWGNKICKYWIMHPKLVWALSWSIAFCLTKSCHFMSVHISDLHTWPDTLAVFLCLAVACEFEKLQILPLRRFVMYFYSSDNTIRLLCKQFRIGYIYGRLPGLTLLLTCLQISTKSLGQLGSDHITFQHSYHFFDKLYWNNLWWCQLQSNGMSCNCHLYRQVICANGMNNTQESHA